MSTKTTNAKLRNALTVYLAKKAQLAKLDAEVKAAKAELDTMLDQVAAKNGFINGRFGIPDVSMVSVVMNPPKLIWATDGKALEPVDREGLALLLPDKYTRQDVRIADIMNAVVAGNKDVTKVLEKKGIKAVQESRYDIKKA